ncbi:MAG: hypothetical protein LH475_03305 [Cryobacterium sp.]|uniref:hypothetical protein n=1 Tax=unclassified Cryobacterium TaxID=2649013 RepID=UPI001A233257|nr:MULTISPECIES: hypothetical protein [unclassified Cryobacterium]MCY7403651.1 hypothetical protein [Cryobacterium sp.]MEC5155638.1 hypothetical protein [Cryobacterium sp. CAN_C3]
MTTFPISGTAGDLLRRGRPLEWFTLGWKVVGVIVLATIAITASSVAMAGFAIVSYAVRESIHIFHGEE